MTEAKVGSMYMYNVIVPSVLQGSETWEINAGLRRKVDVFEMSCLIPIRGVTMWDRMSNEDIEIGCGLKYKLSERVDQSVIRWYEHMERISEEKLEKNNFDVH